MNNACTKCGVGELMNGVMLLDFRTCPVRLAVAGDPDALLLKDYQESRLEARVCNNCGFTELYALDPKKLDFGRGMARRNTAQ